MLKPCPPVQGISIQMVKAEGGFSSVHWCMACGWGYRGRPRRKVGEGGGQINGRVYIGGGVGKRDLT